MAPVIKSTLTTARNQAGAQVCLVSFNDSCSNSRIIPYAELYNNRTGIMETPAEHLQRAAEDEEQRRSDH